MLQQYTVTTFGKKMAQDAIRYTEVGVEIYILH